MAGLLAEQGYSVLLDGDETDRSAADVWVVNSCSVKNPSELAFVKEIARAKETGKKVVLAGCVAQHSPRDPRWDGLSVVGVQQIERVVEVVEETIKGNTVQLVRERTEVIEVTEEEKTTTKKKNSGGAPLSLPKIRRNPFVEIIPINTGCLNEWWVGEPSSRGNGVD
jgi:threonylcarbamoyladenosine tRNA methylthiotransferase CDKAL1